MRLQAMLFFCIIATFAGTLRVRRLHMHRPDLLFYPIFVEHYA